MGKSNKQQNPALFTSEMAVRMKPREKASACRLWVPGLDVRVTLGGERGR